MNTSFFAKNVLAGVAALISSCLFASSDVELKGTWTVTINTNSVRVQGYRIENYSDNGQTGTLQLKLMLTSEPYDGGTIDGRVVFSKRYEPLSANEYYYNIDETQSCSTIPGGKYYRTLVLLNYIDDEYRVTDYINFDGMITISDSDPESDVHFTGSWHVEYNEADDFDKDDNMHVTGGAIANQGDGRSDSLKMIICCSLDPFTESGTYWKVAEKKYAPLDGGYEYSGVDVVLPVKRYPPHGYYQITLTIWEWNGYQYELVRYFGLDGLMEI